MELKTVYRAVDSLNEAIGRGNGRVLSDHLTHNGGKPLEALGRVRESKNAG